jgi:hypothetical protein
MKHFLILSLLFFGFATFWPSNQAYAQCPTVANVVVRTHTNISCFGANDGTITVDFADASLGEPYNFELYDLNAGAVVIGAPEVEDKPTRSVVYSAVPPGTYAVLLFKGGCGYPGGALTIIEPPFGFVVEEPAQLAVTPTVQPDCDPSPTGTGQIDIVVIGGTAPYTIVWTGPTPIANGTTSTSANLNAGTYNVDITDDNGCNIDQDIVIAVTTQADAGAATNVACGTNSIVLSANAAGAGEIGTWTSASGTVVFSDPNDPNATASNLSVGTNTLTWTITDVGLICAGSSDDIVVTFSNISLTTSGDILLDCNGDADGAGSFTRAGGTGGYSWTLITNTAGATFTAPGLGNPSANKPFTGGAAGVITLRAQDNSTCSDEATITIAQPPTLSAVATTVTNVLCNGDATGAIDITVSGGTAGYTM